MRRNKIKCDNCGMEQSLVIRDGVMNFCSSFCEYTFNKKNDWLIPHENGVDGIIKAFEQYEETGDTLDLWVLEKKIKEERERLR